MTEELALRSAGLSDFSTLFPGCSLEVWNRVKDNLRTTSLREGHVLFSAGDETKDFSLFSVLEGDVGLEIPSISPVGDKSVIVRLKQPKLIGWPDERSICTARICSRSAKVLVIPHHLVGKHLMRDPSFAETLLMLQSDRCRPYIRKIQLLMEESTERVAILLEDMASKIERLALPSPTPEKRYRLRHVQIAEESGLSRETVSRIIERNDPRIQSAVERLSTHIKIVGRGGKLLAGQYEERVSEKSNELMILAKEIVGGLFDRLGVEKRGTRYRKEVNIILSQLMFGLKPGLALTRPEKGLLNESGRPKLLSEK